MAGRTRRSTSRHTEAREINLSGFSDEELRQLAAEHGVELAGDADRETVVAKVTDAIRAREAAAAAAGDEKPDAQTQPPADPPADPPASETPPAAEASTPRAPRARRRSSDGPVATRDILHAGHLIAAGDPIPDDFPEDLLAKHYEAGTIE